MEVAATAAAGGARAAADGADGGRRQRRATGGGGDPHERRGWGRDGGRGRSGRRPAARCRDATGDGRRARPRQAAKDEDEAAQRGKGGGSDRNPKL